MRKLQPCLSVSAFLNFLLEMLLNVLKDLQTSPGWNQSSTKKNWKQSNPRCYVQKYLPTWKPWKCKHLFTIHVGKSSMPLEQLTEVKG